MASVLNAIEILPKFQPPDGRAQGALALQTDRRTGDSIANVVWLGVIIGRSR